MVKIQHCFMVRENICYYSTKWLFIRGWKRASTACIPNCCIISICLQDLQPQVKLKLLLSLFHIGRRNLEAWKAQLDGILSVAKEDSEPWVCMLAELIKTFPETGMLLGLISEWVCQTYFCMNFIYTPLKNYNSTELIALHY